jgi:carboxymethylenebutenolidase
VAERGQWDHKWGQILTYDIQAGSGAQTRVISTLTPIDITKGSRIEFLSKMSSGRYGTMTGGNSVVSPLHQARARTFFSWNQRRGGPFASTIRVFGLTAGGGIGMPKESANRREVLKKAGQLSLRLPEPALLCRGSARKHRGPRQKQPSRRRPGRGLSQSCPLNNKSWRSSGKNILASEFKAKSAEAAINTMVERPSVNHVPVMTGGVGRKQLKHFYGNYFIPQMPPDTEIIPISRTIGHDRLADEFVFKFTHTLQMDWLLPGVAPTNRPVEVVTVVIVQFKDGKIASERIHWDQASVLVQLGLLDPGKLLIAGVETVRKVLDPDLPSNELMKRTLKDAELEAFRRWGHRRCYGDLVKWAPR